VRILFSVRKPSNVRHYDSVLRALAAAGHDIELVKEHLGGRTWPPFVLALAEQYPNIHLSTTPKVAKHAWWELANRLRRARFYVRFLGPEYRDTPALLSRARKRSPRPAVWLGETIGRTAFGRRLVAGALNVLEQSTRSAQAFHSYLREQQPDVVILTPLVVLKTTQLDMARAARELGIRNVFAVASWDHLSSKGELTFQPQQITVWNDIQKREAVQLHGMDPEKIAVTGAQLFDVWFDRQPATAREMFCARVGLRADRPIVLYVCSSLLEGSPPEPPFVLDWVRRLRASGHPVLERCGILVRPHYQQGDAWTDVDLSPFENVACWPPLGDSPVDARSKADYFDSMYHASAVVGLNTSAMIEAAILNRPVHTVLLPQFQESQEGTLHFHYLLDPDAPLLRATRTLDDHLADVAAVLDGRDPDPDRSARFVRTFVRPGAQDVPATDRVVRLIEQLGAAPAPAPVPVPVWTAMIRPLLVPFARAAERRAQRMEEEALRLKAERIREHREKKQAALNERRQQRMTAKAELQRSR
jgi:hypothetical protein